MKMTTITDWYDLSQKIKEDSSAQDNIYSYAQEVYDICERLENWHRILWGTENLEKVSFEDAENIVRKIIKEHEPEEDRDDIPNAPGTPLYRVRDVVKYKQGEDQELLGFQESFGRISQMTHTASGNMDIFTYKINDVSVDECEIICKLREVCGVFGN